MIVIPSLEKFPRSLTMAPFEKLASTIMGDDNETLLTTSVLTDEAMAVRIGFVQAREKAPDIIGDTVVISRSALGTTSMCFLDYTCVQKESLAVYNTIASILHPAGLSVYGSAYFVHVKQLDGIETANEVTKEDIIFILQKRVQHCGVVLTENPQEIIVNNAWHVIRGPDIHNLGNRHKNVITIDDLYFLVLRGDPEVVFLFLDKELKTLDDLDIMTYQKLKNRLVGVI